MGYSWIQRMLHNGFKSGISVYSATLRQTLLCGKKQFLRRSGLSIRAFSKAAKRFRNGSRIGCHRRREWKWCYSKRSMGAVRSSLAMQLRVQNTPERGILAILGPITRPKLQKRPKKHKKHPTEDPESADHEI